MNELNFESTAPRATRERRLTCQELEQLITRWRKRAPGIKISSIESTGPPEDIEADERKNLAPSQNQLTARELEQKIKKSELKLNVEISERTAMWERIKKRERRSVDSKIQIEQMNVALLDISDNERVARENRDRVFYQRKSKEVLLLVEA
jgi:hypothetical protein